VVVGVEMEVATMQVVHEGLHSAHQCQALAFGGAIAKLWPWQYAREVAGGPVVAGLGVGLCKDCADRGATVVSVQVEGPAPIWLCRHGRRGERALELLEGVLMGGAPLLLNVGRGGASPGLGCWPLCELV